VVWALVEFTPGGKGRSVVGRRQLSFGPCSARGDDYDEGARFSQVRGLPWGMRMLRRLLTIVFLSCCFASNAAAQARLVAGGMDLRLVRPPLDSKGLLTVNGADILGENALSFGLVLDAGFGILPFEGFVNDPTMPAEDARRTSRLVDALFTGTLHMNWGIANLLVVGAQLPIQIIAGPDVTVPGQYGGDGQGGLSYEGLGGIVLHGKVRILDPQRGGFGLAASLQVEFPTASPSELVGDPILALTPSLIAEFRPVRELRVNLEVGYRLGIGEGAVLHVGGRTEPGGPTASQAALVPGVGQDLRYEDLLRIGVGAGWRVSDAVELALELNASQVIDAWGQANALSMEGLAGVKIFVERNSYLMIGGGAGIPTGGFQAADARALVGFVFEPSIGDRDGDGIRDDSDQCPDEREDLDAFADEDGCPDPDNDRDGILDISDRCPMIPEDRDGDEDEDGCPEGGPGDRDGDGILDNDDQCPDAPEDRDGFQDQDGCPDPDNDRDGRLDTDDLCPNDPEDIDHFADGDGCPDPDNDSDHILDRDDHCPTRPETWNNVDDQDGCPDHGPVEFTGGGVVFFEQIQFALDSAVILPQSLHIVDSIAAALNGNPQLTLVEVQGHADDQGSDEYNIRLTRDRAASVVEALVQRGIDRRRLRSAGYGERCPLIPGTSQRARAANRRVEIKIVRTEDGPVSAALVCRAGRSLAPR
jgi:outer membrane protein OmpA-like peptidoglycan-associated protein